MNLRLYGLLIEQARRRKPIHYAETYGPGRTNRRLVGPQLAEINRHEIDGGRPMLSVLVVNAATERPGAGFWLCAESVGRFRPGDDKPVFLKE